MVLSRKPNNTKESEVETMYMKDTVYVCIRVHVCMRVSEREGKNIITIK